MAFEVQEVAMTRLSPGRSRFGLVLALVALAVGSFTPALAFAEAGELPYGIRWITDPFTPCGTGEVGVRFSICECRYDLFAAKVDSAEGAIVLGIRDRGDIACITCVPDSSTVSLGTLAPGFHARLVVFDFEGSVGDTVESAPIAFAVRPDCPPPGGIPFLEHVVVGQGPPCPDCPDRACPGDSINVALSGTFPNPCTALGNITLLPSMLASPLAGPPTLRLEFETNTCLGPAECPPGATPWSATVRIPALPFRDGFPYVLPLEGWLSDACDPNDSLGTLLGRTHDLFTVAASCSTNGYSCFNVGWNNAVMPGDDPLPGAPSDCDAYVDPVEGALLVFRVGALASAVSGVQGRLALSSEQAALRIGDLTPLVAGWQVAQSPHPDGGIRFLAFAGPGAEPLPASRSGTTHPLFRVKIDVNRVEIPERTWLTAGDLLVSDPAGQSVPMCPQITLSIPGQNTAILCRLPATCDANRDGQSDVRDLVLLVGCLNPPENARIACPDSSVADCDRDSDFDLADVFCCARLMLGGPPGGEGDTLRRDAPEIALRFGLPHEGEGGTLEVPLSVEGMAAVVAARFDVAYPDARYEVVDVAFPDVPSSWMKIHDVRNGRVSVALLDLSGMHDGAVPATYGVTTTLRLRLKPGATAGGELSVAGHDFAAADGYALVTPNAAPVLELAPTGRVALSAARPNPFGTTTAFALTLPAAGPAEVAVFDAAGRRVATLLRESNAAAGVYSLAWNGVEDSGGKAAGGVYFVRVVGGTGNVSRKLLYLPGAAR
jgi:hypothetical protein